MNKKDSVGCVNCAYVDKEGNGMWCPFHDLPVTTRNVCKNYLSEYESPQWTSITKGLVNGVERANDGENFTKGDKVAFTILGILFGLSLAWMIFCIGLLYF